MGMSDLLRAVNKTERAVLLPETSREPAGLDKPSGAFRCLKMWSFCNLSYENEVDLEREGGPV